jgi:hypothetical protein
MLIDARTFALAALSSALAACSGGGGEGSDAAPAPAFSLTAPGSSQLPRGGLAEVRILVLPEAGFDGLVELRVEGLPQGLSAVLGETSVRSGEVELSLAADASAPLGEHPLTIVGRSAALVRSAGLLLEIVDPGIDFELQAELRQLAVEQGATGGALRFSIEPRGAATPPAPELVLEGLPAGASSSFVAVGEDFELQVEAAAATPPGSHALTLAATAEGLRRELPILLQVLPPRVDQGLTLGLPRSVQVRRGATTAAQVEVRRAPGVTGNVGLQVRGLPADLAAVVDDDPVRGAVALLTFAAGATAPLGEFLLTVDATAGGTATGSAALLLQVVGEEVLPDVRVQRVEFAQGFFAADPGLVGGKPALLRAHVLAERPGVPAPRVRVRAYDGDLALGERDLDGPALLPAGEEPAVLGASFRTGLPAEWIRTGVEFVVAVDPAALVADRDERNDAVRVAPRIGASTGLDLVVVPLRLAGREAGAFSGHRELLLAHWPLAEAGVTIRAPYTVTSVQDVGSDGTGWSEVLAEISALRRADGSGAHYYGVVPVSYSGGVAGVGYVGAPVAIGWHRSLDVMLHELGHNFGLRHAPCGGPGGVDLEYPYANGIIGHWGHDARSGAVVDPRSTVDLMSYCRPDWVSGHYHEKVRQRLGGSALRDDGAAGGGEIPLLALRGVIPTAGPARLVGVLRRQGMHRPETRGDLELRLTFGGGRTARFPVASHELGCGTGSGERHFLAEVPDPGELEQVELLRGGEVLLREVGRRPAVEGLGAASSGLGLRLAERDGDLHLSWDASVWPRLALTRVGVDGRTALALDLRGGAAVLPLAGLPDGGVFEVAASDGIEGFSLRVPR